MIIKEEFTEDPLIIRRIISWYIQWYNKICLYKHECTFQGSIKDTECESVRLQTDLGIRILSCTLEEDWCCLFYSKHTSELSYSDYFEIYFNKFNKGKCGLFISCSPNFNIESISLALYEATEILKHVPEDGMLTLIKDLNIV